MTQSSRQQQLEGKQRKLTVIGSTSYSPGVLRRFSKLLLGSMGRIEETKQNVQLVGTTKSQVAHVLLSAWRQVGTRQRFLIC